MSKLGQLSDETKELVLNIAAEYGIERFINVEPMNILKSKQLISISKAGAKAEYLSKKIDTVCVCIYENAFLRLSERQKELVVRDALNTVSYDTEKGKIIIGCPSITVTTGGLKKYGEELLSALECGVIAIQQLLEEEKEEKANKNNNKRGSKK